MNTLFATEKERDSPRKPFVSSALEAEPNLGSQRGAQSDLDLEDTIEEDRHHNNDREVTLNSATLLGVFFGLVLVCALCFGLGFTLGKRSSDTTTRASSGTSNSGTTNQAATDALLSNPSRPKPSATSQNQTASPPASDDAQSADSTGDDSAATTPQASYSASQKVATRPAEPPTVVAAPSPAPARSAKPSAQLTTPARSAAADNSSNVKQTALHATTASTAPGTAAPGTLMVQIAAVSKSTDAEVLVAALTRRGYSVAIRHEPADSLLHVQVGPFANRDDAIAMRQKLLSDGYNAILK